MFSKIKQFSYLGSVLIVIAASLWALDGIIRRSLYELPPIIIVFYEHLIGSLLLIPIAAPQLRKFRAKILHPQTLRLAGTVALLSGLIGTLLFTQALVATNFIPFSIVFLLQKLQPLFAIGTAVLLLKEKLPRHFVGWAGLAIVAAYFVTFPNGVVNLSVKSIFAALAALGAAAAWGSSTVFSKMLINRTSETVATSLRFWLTTFFALPAVFLLGAGPALAAPTPSMIGRLILIALSTGMVALWIYYTGLKRTPARVSTILELTFPLLAVFVDMYLYKTTLLPTQYLAALVLIAAMVMVSKTTKPEQTPHQQ